MALISPLKLNISKKLKEDRDFRKRFFRGQAQDEIAMSIRSLREKRKMRQIDLAKTSRMKQSAISRIEQADYSSWSFNTLFRVAEALDARLRVTLEPTEAIIARYETQEAADAVGSVESCGIYMPTAIGLTAQWSFLTSGVATTTESGTATWSYQIQDVDEILTNIGTGAIVEAIGGISEAVGITYIRRPPYGDETTRTEHRNKTGRAEPTYPYQMACA